MRFPDDADIRDYIRATVPYIQTGEEGTTSPLFSFKMPYVINSRQGRGVLTSELLSGDGPHEGWPL